MAISGLFWISEWMQATLSLVNISIQLLGMLLTHPPSFITQVFDVLADQVRQKIIRKVHQAKWFSVIADKVTDVSKQGATESCCEIQCLSLRRPSYWDLLSMTLGPLVLHWLTRSLAASKLMVWISLICEARHIMEQVIWLAQLMVQQFSLLQITLWPCTFTVLHTVSTLLL